MAMIEVPIEFEYEGILFSGRFSAHSGTLSYWDLNLQGYSYGSLVKYSSGWQWCPNGKMPMFLEDYMEKFFIDTVEQYLNRVRL